MPLIPKKMKKDMPAQDGPKSLGIAYSVKRKHPKKMANGGPVSAKSEKRPMPSEMDNDHKMAMQNSGNKPPKQDSMTSQPERKQASKGMRTTPIKHPKMVPSDAFSSRMRSQEDYLQDSAGVNDGPQHQPPQEDNEMEAKKSGPSTPALKMKMMAKGGMINEDVSMHDAEMDNDEHPAGLESDNDEMGPSEEEFMAGHFAKGGDVQPTYENKPDNGYGAIIFKADGGEVTDEEALEHHASVASAIMAKRAKMMAEGGEVDIDSNNEEQPNGYYHQNEDAALKENYDEDMDDVSQPEDSNEHGDMREDDEENDHDSSIVGKIMRKRKSSPISK